MRNEDRYGARKIPPPRSLADLRREIAEKKWVEARSWAEEQVGGKKYGLPKCQRPNRAVQRAPKRQSTRWGASTDSGRGTAAQGNT